MKNKLLIMVTLAMVTGSLLVGCGGNETANDTANVGAEVNVEQNTENKTNAMSAEAEEIFAMFRAKVAENNVVREEAQKQYPNMTILPLVEVDSPDGLDCFGTFYCSLEDAAGLDGLLTAFICENYNFYYIDYIGESDLGVEIDIYGGM